MPDAGCRQIQQKRAAQSACTDDENTRRLQSLLPCSTDFGEQDVTGVATEFVSIHRIKDNGAD